MTTTTPTTTSTAAPGSGGPAAAVDPAADPVADRAVAEAVSALPAVHPSRLGSRGAAGDRSGVDITADPDDVRRVLDGRWGHVRDALREHLPADFCHPTDHLGTQEHRALTTERLLALSDMGGHRTAFSTDVGGTADVGASTVHFEHLGLADLSLTIKAGVQWGLFAGTVQALGTSAHHRRYLPAAMDGSLLGCFAMTESGHGSDVASLGTTATYDAAAGEFVVHTPDAAARKDYIGNAARDGRVAVVFAQLTTAGESHGVHALLVPLREPSGAVLPGVTITDDGRKGGLNGVDNGRISFDHVRVPRENLLDRYGSVEQDGTYSSSVASRNARFFTTLGALVKGRVCISGGALAATRQAMAIALTYAEERTQFPRAGGEGEVTLLDYRTHQRRLLPLLARTIALGFAQDDLTAELHEVQQAVLEGSATAVDPEAQKRLEHHAAGMKAMATWHATTAIQAAREACGGNGYLSENRLVQLKADTDVFTTFEGDNTVLLQLVAKGLLGGYRETFTGLDRRGRARAVTASVLETLAVRTEARALAQRLAEVSPLGHRSAAGGDDAPVELVDRAWQLRALAWRERRVLEALVARMRAASKTVDRFALTNEVQDHMVLAARVHVERVVAESFASAVDAQPQGPTRELLTRVLDLHVLSELERDRAWFLERGWISPRRSKALTAAVNDLCAELRPHTTTLVAGFGIPRAWWGAAITA